MLSYEVRLSSFCEYSPEKLYAFRTAEESGVMKWAHH
jgi:hypothetical protein